MNREHAMVLGIYCFLCYTHERVVEVADTTPPLAVRPFSQYLVPRTITLSLQKDGCQRRAAKSTREGSA